ncbi:hypothetical protein GCM10020229_08480 [Kitasatospora albolonga]
MLAGRRVPHLRLRRPWRAGSGAPVTGVGRAASAAAACGTAPAVATGCRGGCGGRGSFPCPLGLTARQGAPGRRPGAGETRPAPAAPGRAARQWVAAARAAGEAAR